MAHTVSWYHELDVVYVELDGDLTEADFNGLIEELLKFINSSPKDRVHLMYNVEKLQTVPSMPVLTKGVQALMAGTEKLDLSLLYGLNRATRFLLELLVRATPLRIKVFNSQQEAEDFMQLLLERDQSTADL